MAWRAGRFMVAQGASVTIDFNWQGKFMGAQFAQARPILDLGPFLWSIDGERTLNITKYGLTARSGDSDPAWIYHVTVQNPQEDAFVIFDLTGGEVGANAP
jgi:hypothetical protein